MSFVKALQFRKFTLKITPWWTRKFNFDFDVEILLRWNLDKSRIKTIIGNFYCFFVIFFGNIWYIFGNFCFTCNFTGKHWNPFEVKSLRRSRRLPDWFASCHNQKLAFVSRSRVERSFFFFRKSEYCNETWRQPWEKCKNLNVKNKQKNSRCFPNGIIIEDQVLHFAPAAHLSMTSVLAARKTI